MLKKYPSLKDEYFRLVKTLIQAPEQGAAIGNNCYKIRLAISSKGKGKRGGARVVTYLQYTTTKVYLLTIYDKSDKPTVTNSELAQLLRQIP